MNELLPIAAALGGGVLPCLAWLWFWRREDSKHPEPKKLIALAFLAGMAAVAVVIPLEKWAAGFLPDQTTIFSTWSAMEEVIKYLAAALTVLYVREDDEPIDAVIYMVTVALGFAAAENTLFLLSPLSGDTLMQTVLTGNLRFVGATLLHVLSSSTIGLMIALSFYKGRATQAYFTVLGVILAGLLHALFNFFILNTAEAELLRTFGFVWTGVVILLAMLEYVKRIHPVIKRKFL